MVMMRATVAKNSMPTWPVLLASFTLKERLENREYMTRAYAQYQALNALKEAGVEKPTESESMILQAQQVFRGPSVLLTAQENLLSYDVQTVASFFLDTKALAMQTKYGLATLLEPQQSLFAVSASKQAAVEITWNRAQRDNIAATIEEMQKKVQQRVRSSNALLSGADAVAGRMRMLHELLAEVGGRMQLINGSWDLRRARAL